MSSSKVVGLCPPFPVKDIARLWMNDFFLAMCKVETDNLLWHILPTEWENSAHLRHAIVSFPKAVSSKEKLFPIPLNRLPLTVVCLRIKSYVGYIPIRLAKANGSTPHAPPSKM